MLCWCEVFIEKKELHGHCQGLYCQWPAVDKNKDLSAKDQVFTVKDKNNDKD